MSARRSSRSRSPFARVFAIVIALHVGGGAGVFWLAKTQSGRALARVYNVTLFEPPKPEEAEAEVEPPPPPPVVEEPQLADIPAPAAEAPIAAPAAPSAVSSAPPAPTIGGGGGTNWSGKFAGADAFDGPEGAFHAAVTGRFRRHYVEPPEAFGPAELELKVTAKGSIDRYRLARSSGSEKNDQAILASAQRVQSEGLGVTPPEERARIVTVRFVPSS